MAHKVKCSVCGRIFDRDLVQAVRTGARRYAHQTCDPNNKDLVPLVGKQEDPDLIKLKEFIGELFGKEANWARINQQIKQFVEQNGYSYSGILKSLVYFYKVKANSIDKSNYSIGIVPFIYNDAYNYYYSLFLAQNKNEHKDIQKITSKVKEICIPVPAIILPKRLFNFLDEDEGEEDE